MSTVYGETKGFVNVVEQHGPFSKPQRKKIAWNVDYDGDIANIDIATDTNGRGDIQHMRLDNNDIMRMLSVQPVEMPLEQRLSQDFGVPIALEGAIRNKGYGHSYKRSRKHSSRKKHYVNRKNHKTRRHKKMVTNRR